MSKPRELTDADLRALGVDPDDIRRKALETARLIMRDRSLYGFSAQNAQGHRIDPRELLSGPQRACADFYDGVLRREAATFAKRDVLGAIAPNPRRATD